jgi:hypothetical protein
MVTVTIKESTKQAKAFIELMRTLPFVEFHTDLSSAHYDPKFVKKIKAAEKRGQYKEIDPENVWESIGLK